MAKKNQPHIPLYIGDWERDCNVLSVEAEGAWLRIVLKMFTKGKQSSYKVPAKGLQNLWKCDEDKMNEILTELQDNDIGVIKRDGRFIEFTCRRFKKENEISEIRSKAGSSNKTESKGKQKSNKIKANTQQSPDNDSDNDINNDYDIDFKEGGAGGNQDSEIERLKANEELWNWFQKEYISQFKKIDDDFDFVVSQCQLKIDKMRVEDKPQSVKQIKATLESYLNNWVYNKNQNGKAKRANKGLRSTAKVDTSRGPGKL